MILCICPGKGDQVYRDGVQSRDAFPGVFRSVHLAFDQELRQLAANEDLVVLAHGGFDVQGHPVIGERGRDGLRMDAFTLWMNISGLFPDDYRGDVYVSTCHSAEPGPGSIFSFTELLAVNLKGERGPNCNVFGHDGLVRGMIPLPGDAAWRPADIG